MVHKVKLESVYVPSQDIVAREIEGAIIIVPIAAGIGDMEDELFTLNDTGKLIWQKLNGRSTLQEIADALAGEFTASPDEIRLDVLGLAAELLKRKMIVELKAG